jgi:hypothetical protein
MKQEEQTCIEDSHVYITASWLLVANNKEELQISTLLSNVPFRCVLKLWTSYIMIRARAFSSKGHNESTN